MTVRTVVNKTFDEIVVGDSASIQRSIQASDVLAWAAAFGDADLLTGGAHSQGAVGIISSILSAMVSTSLPGPGSVVTSIAVQITAALPLETPITVQLTVRETGAEHSVRLEGICSSVGASAPFAIATLQVTAPQQRIERHIHEHRLGELVERCRHLPAMLTGVVYPCSVDALAGALEAAAAGLIVPVLYAPEAELRRIAELAHLDLSQCQIVPSNDAEDAARKAAFAAGNGEVAALMKGSLHTDVFLHAIMQREAKLRTECPLSHCAVMSAPTYARRFILTDAALNIAPDANQKRGICQNAIGLARALGVEMPKVAVLAAVEVVRTRMQSTVDGAILAKMADRRQIVGGIVDGPLDLDAAVDIEAARIKGIQSPVAGCADILLAPNIEAGNMVYKNMSFMADAQVAGLVVGVRVPVVLTSRADNPAARRFSAAVAVLYADAAARDSSILTPEIAE